MCLCVYIHLSIIACKYVVQVHVLAVSKLMRNQDLNFEYFTISMLMQTNIVDCMTPLNNFN